ncbi:hypothetical protein BB561_001434 [Smittium simulii]|uniref:Ubiquitin-conjugating enzyme E2C-binding protein n=1 Tax=Smittium simulii TaxID=133385 RepID=A0A2T9YUJ9_9FUNG|nr:hypothetical protein BB561_001434 [Smittium simulii]
MTSVYSWGKENIPPLYIETLPNLNITDVYISLPDFAQNDPARILLQKAPKLLCVGYRLPTGELVWSSKIHLKNAFNLNSVTSTICSNTQNALLRVRLQNTAPVNIKNLNIMEMLSSPDLLGNKLDAESLKDLDYISCKNCNAQLSFGCSSVLWNLHQLPTEYWQEMVDFWVCHPEGDTLSANIAKMDSFNQSDLSQHSVPNLNSSRGDQDSSSICRFIKVGATFLQFDSSSFLPKSYITTKSNFISNNLNLSHQNSSSMSIECSCCNTLIGNTISRELNYSPSGTVLHIWQHKVLFCMKNRTQNISSLCVSLSHLLAIDLLYQISAHASYYFIIQSRDTNIPALLLWITSWGIDTCNNNTHPSTLTYFKNGIKTLYYSYDPNNLIHQQ